MFAEQAEKQNTETKPASNTRLDNLTKPTTNQSEQGPSDGQTPKANKETHQTGTRVPVKCHSNRRKRQPLENQKAKPNNMAKEKKEYQKTEKYHLHGTTDTIVGIRRVDIFFDGKRTSEKK